MSGSEDNAKERAPLTHPTTLRWSPSLPQAGKRAEKCIFISPTLFAPQAKRGWSSEATTG
jgi:hypothetical protein